MRKRTFFQRRGASGRVAKRRAMTLIEVVFASSIFIFASAAVLALVFTTGHHLKRSYSYVGSMQNALMARDWVCYILANARADSVEISADGAEIVFNDPNLGEDVISAFRFADEYLMYLKGTADAPSFVQLTGPLEDLRFSFGEDRSIINIVSETVGEERYGTERPIRFDIVIYVRN